VEARRSGIQFCAVHRERTKNTSHRSHKILPVFNHLNHAVPNPFPHFLALPHLLRRSHEHQSQCQAPPVEQDMSQELHALLGLLQAVDNDCLEYSRLPQVQDIQVLASWMSVMHKGPRPRFVLGSSGLLVTEHYALSTAERKGLNDCG
jgi:hypothetical protein